MRRRHFTTLPAVLGLLLMGCLGPKTAAAMAEAVSPPAVVQLDFLKLIKETPDWLAAELRSAGHAQGWKIADGKLSTGDLDVLRYVQRIKAFCYLDRSRSLPYFDLLLEDGSGERARCVTLYPRDLLPDLGVLDFRREVFRVASLDSEEVAACRVPDDAGDTPYGGTDRQAFRQRFFGRSGELLMDSYERYDGDPGFIHHATTLGFYPFRAQFTGYLQITLDE